MSVRVDKYQEKRIVWDKIFTDNSSKQFEYLSYETARAVSVEFHLLNNSNILNSSNN